MSYDIYLNDPITKEPIQLETKHHITGGTYQMGGCPEMWLNITYNYSKLFHDKIDKEKGIRFLYGKSGATSIPILKAAIDTLKDDIDDDYWKATEGNVKQALYGLLAFAQMRPDGIWSGD